MLFFNFKLFFLGKFCRNSFSNVEDNVNLSSPLYRLYFITFKTKFNIRFCHRGHKHLYCFLYCALFGAYVFIDLVGDCRFLEKLCSSAFVFDWLF